MDKELNYLSEKIRINDLCIVQIEKDIANKDTEYSEDVLLLSLNSFIDEKQLLENILNALTINELK